MVLTKWPGLNFSCEKTAQLIAVCHLSMGSSKSDFVTACGICPLNPFYSKRGPLICSMDITWELSERENPRPHPRPAKAEPELEVDCQGTVYTFRFQNCFKLIFAKMQWMRDFVKRRQKHGRECNLRATRLSSEALCQGLHIYPQTE